MSSDERCTGCNKSTADAGVAAFSYCSGCRKVSVQTPYCSRECQVSDYKKHKSFCSKGATPSTPSPVTTGLNTALTRQAAALASRPTATWIIFDIEKGQHLPIELRTPSTDPAVLKIVESDRKRIIAIRNRALNDKDPLSIGLLAENVLYKPRTPQSPLVRTLVADQLASNEKLWLMKRAQLKKEFEVDDAGLDAYLKRADGCKEEWRLQMLKEQELAAVQQEEMLEEEAVKSIVANDPVITDPKSTQDEKMKAAMRLMEHFKLQGHAVP